MVDSSLCSKCQHHGYLHGSVVICEYMLDANRKPAGHIVNGVWKRSARGKNCPEFAAGKARSRKVKKLYISDRPFRANTQVS